MIKCSSSTILTDSSAKRSPEKEIFKKGHTDRGDNGKDVNRIALKNFSNVATVVGRGESGGGDLPSQSTYVCETFLVHFF